MALVDGSALFPRIDPVGSDGPELPSAIDVISTEIAPHAAEADLNGVTRASIDALAEAGLHGSPLQPPAAQRELSELLAGADASTWFCWVQHQTPLQTMRTARTEGSAHGIDHRLLRDMASGHLLSGVAFAHLRRTGSPNPTARRIGRAWAIRGSLDWVTSWDIADWFLLMVTDEDSGRIVSAVLPAGYRQVSGSLPGLIPGDPLRLLAMSGTHTRPVRLDDVRLHEEDVICIEDADVWRTRDVRRTSNVSPGLFGVARGAIAELHVLAEDRGSEQLRHACGVLIEDLRACRRAAYAAADERVAAQDTVNEPERADDHDPGPGLRAEALRIAQRATTSVIVARSGSSMLSGSSAERRAREALFLHVQGQSNRNQAAYFDDAFGRALERDFGLSSGRHARFDNAERIVTGDR